MSGPVKTLAAQVDPEDELYEDFIEQKKEMSAQSNSEVVRNLMRSGIEHKNDSPQQPTARAGTQNPVIDSHLVNRIETLLAVVAYLFGASSVAETLTPLIGGLLSGILIAGAGVIVFVMFAWVHLPTNTQSTNGQTTTISTEGDA